GFRAQSYIPRAVDLSDSATLTIRLMATGGSGTYSIPWTKQGIPMNSDGAAPSPGRQPFREADQVSGTEPGRGLGKSSLLRPWGSRVVDDTLPPYMAALAPLMTALVPDDRVGTLNFGSKFPVYTPPPGFTLRRGASPSDFFLTGVFMASGLRI